MEESMKIFFSKRHFEALRDKKLHVSFSKRLRTAILRTLEKYSQWGGYNDKENFTFESLEETLKTFYGVEHLEAFTDEGSRAPANVDKVILNGYPTELIDVIEAWFNQNYEPQLVNMCEKELNDVLMIHDSPWRFINGFAILVDSEYLHQEVRAKTLSLLKGEGAIGAFEEFHEAVRDLQIGETKDAVIKAHKSVESLMKFVLGIDEHITFGKLLRKLLDSGLIPEYYEEFLKHFEIVALGAVKERNLPGRGHGQGIAPKTVPKSLAEFATNLAGTLNLFIIHRWIENKPVSISSDKL